MTAAAWAVATVLAITAVAAVRTGLQQWGNAGRPFSYWLRNSLFDAESRAGYDRGILVFGLMCAFFAAILVFGAVGGPHPGRGAASLGILVSVAGMLVSLGLFMSIMYFNRPRFLVPPHLRGEQEPSPGGGAGAASTSL